MDKPRILRWAFFQNRIVSRIEKMLPDHIFSFDIKESLLDSWKLVNSCLLNPELISFFQNCGLGLSRKLVYSHSFFNYLFFSYRNWKMFQENISKLPYKLEDVLTVKLSLLLSFLNRMNICHTPLFNQFLDYLEWLSDPTVFVIVNTRTVH